MAAEAAALELRIAVRIEKIAPRMEGFAEDGLFTDAVVVDENEEDGFSAASEASALEAAYGDMQDVHPEHTAAGFVRCVLVPARAAGGRRSPQAGQARADVRTPAEEFPEAFGFPIGVTTRAARRETHGVHYDFTTERRSTRERTSRVPGVRPEDHRCRRVGRGRRRVTRRSRTRTERARARRKGAAAEVEDARDRDDVAGSRAMKEAGLDAVYVFFAHPEGFEGAEKTHVANLKHAGEPLETIDQRVEEARAELERGARA